MEVIYEGSFPEVFECEIPGRNSSESYEDREEYQTSLDSGDENQSILEIKSMNYQGNSDADFCVGDEKQHKDSRKHYSFNVYDYSDDDEEDGFENFKEKVIV